MQIIALLIVLAIIGLLAMTQLKPKSPAKPVDVGGVQISTPQTPQDLKKFEKDLNKAMQSVSESQRQQMDDAAK